MDVQGKVETIAVDLPCLGCGYNLRMLPVEGRCSECGSRVQCSLEDTVLRWGPRHLRRMSRCAVWAAATAVAMPVLLSVGTVSVEFLMSWLFSQAHFGPADLDKYFFYDCLLQSFVWLPVVAAVVVHVAAVWRGTCPPPRERLRTSEKLVRIGLLIFVLAALMAPINNLLTALSVRDSRIGVSSLVSVRDAIAYSMPILLLSVALYPWQAAAWVSCIYRRAGLPAKGGFTRWRLRTLAASVVLLAGVLAIITVLEHSSSGVPREAEIFVVVPAVFSMGILIVSAIGTVIALFLFAQRMRKLAAMSPVSEDAFTAVMAAPAQRTGVNEADGNP